MSDERVSTVYLGQFTDERAARIAKALEEAGIIWWQKGSGRLTRFFFMGDWGVRLFVDRSRLPEAQEIARVSSEE